MVPRPLATELNFGTNPRGRLAILIERDHVGCAAAEGEMQLELVERARRGDHDAFAALAGAALFRLDAAARLILRDPDQAKDAVQETLVRAWRDLPTLRSPDRFEAWLHRLLVRACIDEARRLRRHRLDVNLIPIDAPLIDDATSLTADRDQLERGFSRLEPEARALIVLHHYLDLPLPDVAIAMHIPLGTAKSRLHRALQSMRAALDADARPRAEAREGRFA
jgi:RNA polymerase sigma-70 factor (ECF subfamily)